MALAVALAWAVAGIGQAAAAPLPLPSPSLPPVGSGPSPSPAPPPPPPRASPYVTAAPQRPAAASSPAPAAAAVVPFGGGTGPGLPTAGQPSPRQHGIGPPAVLRAAVPAAVVAGQVGGVLLGFLLLAFATSRLWLVQRDRSALQADPALARVADALEAHREAELTASIAVVTYPDGGDPAAQNAVRALLSGSVDPDAALVERADGSLNAVAAATSAELEARLETARRRASKHGLTFDYHAVEDDGRSSARRLLRRARPKLG